MQIIYTTLDSVKIRLSGKVQFESSSGLRDGELPNALLTQLICDAETDVEQELRSRYAVPFRSASQGTYNTLPDHSKRALRIVVDYKAVMKVLATDFGRGSHINGDNYFTATEKEYEKAIMRLLGRDMIGTNEKIDRYKVSPPLEDVMLAKSNAAADDGYRGMIINTDADENDSASYARKSINNPSKSYIRKRGFGGL